MGWERQWDSHRGALFCNWDLFVTQGYCLEKGEFSAERGPEGGLEQRSVSRGNPAARD